jgi:hypothetical protein
MVTQCPKCFVESNNDKTCSACGIIFEKFSARPTTQAQREKTRYMEATAEPEIPLWAELAIPLLAFILAPVFYIFIPNPLFTWIHEFGHAFAGWFAGVAAMPTPRGFTSMGEPSWSFTIFFSAIVGTFAYTSWIKKYWFLGTVFTLTFLFQIYFRFGLSRDEATVMFSWMGEGGEFWISALLVIAYHYEFPEEAHWKNVRYLFLVLGAAAFYSQMRDWMLMKDGLKDVPIGTLITMGGGHLRSDMMTLQEDWAWTEPEMIQSYLTLGKICISLMVINYVVNGIRKLLTLNSNTETLQKLP